MERKLKKPVIYGIILPDISSRLVGNNELTQDSQTASYKHYLSNLQQLLEFLENNNQPNFFGINRSLLSRINSGASKSEIPGNPILPLPNTSELLIFDNILFSIAQYNTADIAGLYGRDKDKFVEIDDVPEEFRDKLKLEGRIIPKVEDIDGQVNYVENVARRASVEAILIRKLIKRIKLEGIEEIRLAGERLWYLGGADIDGSAYIRSANIPQIVGNLNKRDRFDFPCKVVRECTFPLKPEAFDGRYEEYFKEPTNPEWNVSQILESGISLDDVLSGR